jgi:pimeloyl-ACP methyl ester carboxylesterase
MEREVEALRRDPSVMNGLGLAEVVDHYRKRTVGMTPKQFRRGFTNTMSDADAEAAYERYYVPAPGRVIYQAAFANVNPHAVSKVDFHKDDRPPLLVIGNDQDHTIPASVSKEAAKRLGKSKAVVDYKEFAGRPHFPAAAGWEAVADDALDWANRHVGAPAETAEPPRASPSQPSAPTASRTMS